MQNFRKTIAVLIQKAGKIAFVLAPVCLFVAFFSSAMLQDQALMAVMIVLATILLITAVASRAIQERNRNREAKP